MLTSLEGKVRRAIQRTGVTISNITLPSGDKATWTVTYLPNASPADQAAVTAAIAAFDENDPTVIADAQAFDADGIDSNLMIRALGEALWEEIQKCTVINGQTLRTKPQLLARVKALYRNLL